MDSYGDLRARFRRLHQQGCFLIPNPWDAGSAIALAKLGFPALATTSAGLCFARGLPDTVTALSVDEALNNIAEIVAAVGVPVNADFQAGYAQDAGELAHNVARCVATGVAGLSVEDGTGIAGSPLFELAEAADRVRAARSTIDDSGADVMLTGRAECFLYGHPDPLAEAIRRLQAYAEAGAEVLFAPGIRTKADIASLVDAVAPYPVNVLVSSDTGLTVTDLAELGVRRISVGSAFSRVAWGAFLAAARKLIEGGSFEGLTGAASFDELNTLFAE
ncbi:2-methylisocitrate lyase [Mycobacterium sp. 852002-53434_SCH5985345]|uniref:isocitrate lyase/PEP mutase family protein n=1 Tax=unclassified Mycobacterium TaxID=2642494 RepID=UPI0008017308|nr:MULTISPECIES: isocitrate lyase/phosphoenolpyruvate mutase family protein [unclassified Mycobacterium]OBF60879.1 2-methylisocitrate lyase [Mycobacterium sp. 852002-53434_SCH5985345]OBF71960.1 2-methylisocitrate lyase [Mycobacterium sp. 852002-51613_SCH5001154]